MITNVWDEIQLIRRIKKGLWLKTKHRGWIRPALYNEYLSYVFDCKILKEERW